jgi:tRNA-Thr(GGU) m(6)t(6)A37 methyltransferase TsaA
MTTFPHETLMLQPVGIVRSCFREKFGVPRQGGLVPSAVARIQLLPPFNRMEWVDGLQQSTHVWVTFWFHLSATAREKSSVRPPRKGGNERMGVFATRSMFRPNPIGLSALELVEIENTSDGVSLVVRGADMVDGTPVLDIKPYIPYCDRIDDARCEWAVETPATIPVLFDDNVDDAIDALMIRHALPIRDVIREMLAQDPRPAFHRDQLDGTASSDDSAAENGEERPRFYGALLWDWNVRWYYRVEDGVTVAHVAGIEAVEPPG